MSDVTTLPEPDEHHVMMVYENLTGVLFDLDEVPDMVALAALADVIRRLCEGKENAAAMLDYVIDRAVVAD